MASIHPEPKLDLNDAKAFAHAAHISAFTAAQNTTKAIASTRKLLSCADPLSLPMTKEEAVELAKQAGAAARKANQYSELAFTAFEQASKALSWELMETEIKLAQAAAKSAKAKAEVAALAKELLDDAAAIVEKFSADEKTSSTAVVAEKVEIMRSSTDVVAEKVEMKRGADGVRLRRRLLNYIGC